MKHLLLFSGLLITPLLAQPPVTNPNTVVLVGGAYRNGSPGAWADYCKKATEKIYGCAAVDLWGSHTSTRAGVETIFLQRTIFGLPLTATIKGDGGAAAGQFGVGASYGAGMSFVGDVSRWTKMAGTYAACSVSILRENINTKTDTAGVLKNVGNQLVVRIGIGKSF